MCLPVGERKRSDQKFLKDIPQFCMFSSVVHAEFCWICGLFPQSARALLAKFSAPRARLPLRAPEFRRSFSARWGSRLLLGEEV